jgi:hypothetical protein
MRSVDSNWMRAGRVGSSAKVGRVRGLLLASAFAVSACTVGHLSGDLVEDPRNPRPANYKPDILALLRVYLSDPTQIKDAGISEPMLQSIAERRRYVVCLRLNAKKGDGQYAGDKEYVVIFATGRLDQMVEAKPDQCSTAEYQPFPEAQTLTR